MLEQTRRTRVYWMDAARVIAILSISLLHATNRAYANNTGQMAEFLSSTAASSVFKAMVTVFGRCGVPIFLMLSGALLLEKSITDEEGVKRFYKHNLLDLFITCEIWYVLMYWYLVLVEGRLASAGLPYLLFGMIKTMCFVNQVTFDSMWYVPMILCVYLLIPPFAIVLKRASLKVFILPCAVVFLSSMVIPTVDTLLYMAVGWANAAVLALKSANVFSKYFLYVLAGYWINRGGLAKLRTGGVLFGCLLVYGLCCLVQFWAYAQPEDYLIKYDFPLVLVGTGLLFELMRRKISQPPDAGKGAFVARAVTYVSKISFGIYFLHMVIMTVVLRLYAFQGWPRSVKLLFLEAVSVGGSILVIWILSHIGLCRRRLFLIKD